MKIDAFLSGAAWLASALLTLLAAASCASSPYKQAKANVNAHLPTDARLETESLGTLSDEAAYKGIPAELLERYQAAQGTIAEDLADTVEQSSRSFEQDPHSIRTEVLTALRSAAHQSETTDRNFDPLFARYEARVRTIVVTKNQRYELGEWLRTFAKLGEEFAATTPPGAGWRDFALLLAAAGGGYTNPDLVPVRPHYRDGSYVPAHVRTAPNDYKWDNLNP